MNMRDKGLFKTNSKDSRVTKKETESKSRCLVSCT